MKDNSLYLDEFYKRDCGQKINYLNPSIKVIGSEDKGINTKLIKISSKKYKKLGLTENS